MDIGALAPYENALLGGGQLGLHAEDGRFVALDVSRYLGDVDAADRTVIDRCHAPVLDIGCGPGRFVSALHGRGVAALGVDIAETAVEMTRGQGFPALLRSVFGDIPGEGRWPTALLMDGNIGIGGDPVRLLARIRTLLAPHGCVIVEAHPDADRFELMQVRFSEHGRPVGPAFGWAEVGLDALRTCADICGLRVAETWTADGRPFVTLTGEGASLTSG